MYEEFISVIDEEESKLTALSDAIWDNPETAFSEHKSVQLLTDFFDKEGFVVKKGVYGVETAFTASYGNGRPIIGILGEYDALAGLSQVNDCFEKKPLVHGGNGHGCGHNLLGVGSAAAALAVKAYLLAGGKGTVIYYGCPGEEGGSGKAFMARGGAFDDLDVALCWHPAETNNVVQNTSLANIQVLYRFYGTSAHAAANPEEGRSALDAVELMNVGTNFLREHMIDQARIHYAIVNTGGFSPNVVQPFAEVLYLIRSPKMSQAQELFQRVNKIAEGMAMATETRMEYQIIKSCSNLVPNHVLEQELYESMQIIPIPDYTDEDLRYAKKITETSESSGRRVMENWIASMTKEEDIAYLEERKQNTFYSFLIPYEKKLQPTLMKGSTDVGDVSWKCPTGQIETSTWAPNSGGHSWQIVAQGKGSIAHKAMLYCGKVLGMTAIRLMQEPDKLEAARQEYKSRIAGEKYIPIPDDVEPIPMDEIGK